MTSHNHSALSVDRMVPHLHKYSRSLGFDETELAQLDGIISRALAEDSVPGYGDLAARSTIPATAQARAVFLAKADGVLSGLAVAIRVFQHVDPDVLVKFSKREGDEVQAGEEFGTVTGPARSIVVGERLALNFMQRMGGIATQTRAMVRAAEGTGTKILDTRKTVPGLRLLDKLAVRAGGGSNHRFSLADMLMLKDNHVAVSGGVVPAIKSAFAYLEARGVADKVPVEVETRTLEEVKEVVACLDEYPVNRIMLDNMTELREDGTVDTSLLEAALQIVDGRVDTEASGNVTVESIPAISKTGVTFISSGALTHSVMALDISLKIKVEM